jgi:Zn-dependent peptidase ImmA (M78 family)/transcriptional regulator with XRE-family HTH domain
MQITSEQIGERLRITREARQLTQEAIAKELGLPRSAISLIESGQRQISTLELTRMAAFYGKPLEWFVNPDLPAEPEDVAVALFRADQGLESEIVQKQAMHCLEIFREGARLSRLLGRESGGGLPQYDLPEPRSTGQAIAQGHQLADLERRRLGFGNAPVRNLPELLGEQGIWAAGLALPDEISGIFLTGNDFGMAILVNTGHASVRRRFSYAHEFAHALADRDAAVTVSRAHNAKSRTEQRANAFAAAFLMPADGVRSFVAKLGKGGGSRREEAAFDELTQEGIRGELRNPPRSQTVTYADIALLSRFFGVSYLAAAWRLRGLGILNADETEGLLGQSGAAQRYLRAVRVDPDLDENGRSGPADDHRDQDLGWQILPLALEAWRREEISESRLLEVATLLGIDDETVLSLAEGIR